MTGPDSAVSPQWSRILQPGPRVDRGEVERRSRLYSPHGDPLCGEQSMLAMERAPLPTVFHDS